MPDLALRILLIEDNPGDVRLMAEALKDAKRGIFVLESVGTLADGLTRLAAADFDVVLLDLSLPDSHGLQTFRTLQAQVANVPVVVMSGDEDESVAMAAVNEGAQDFLVKQRVDGDAVGRAIRYALERHRMLEQMRQLAILDPLTNLSNRRGFLMLCQQPLELANRTKKPFTLLFVDIDRMKGINDSFGHAEGDRALVDTAGLMVMSFRKSDIIARLGGDEFCALLAESTDASSELVITRLKENVAAFNAAGTRAYTLGLSVGVAQYDPDEPCPLDELLGRADAAMYRHKRREIPAA
ncbi:MAG: diguanylate cyclase response regulator [Candidatus Dormibacteraeota bacterium]|nr:diguanylate cyclase response regulator [Candidatus Dormibacteraeota bacterium]